MRPPRPPNRARRSSAANLPALCLASLVGCTEPAFRDLPCDASACLDARAQPSTGNDHDGDAAVDASPDTQPDSSTKEGAELVGQYGLRIRFYSLGNVDKSHYHHEIIMLARISQDPNTGRVDMVAKRCKDEGYSISKSFPGAQQTFVWPGVLDLPEEKFTLVFEGKEFHTVADPRPIGYVAEQPAGCLAGTTTLPARPGQVWQQNCTCHNDPLPMTADDCRITDVDGDGAPGLSVKQDGLVKTTTHVRAEDRCRITGGTLDKDGKHRAHYIEDYDFIELGCSGIACGRTVTGCAVDFNPVEFEPLEGKPAPDGSEWDCPSLVAGSASGALFSREILRFPDACDPG